MSRMKRQRPFLQSILREAKQKERKAMVDYANKDQINAVSELVMNVLHKNVPISPHVIRELTPHKNALRELARRKTSLKRRKAILSRQRGSGFWKNLECCHRSSRQ